MTIQSASASLTAEFQVLPRTGFAFAAIGVLDSSDNSIKPFQVGTWSAFAGKTWDNLTTWAADTVPIRWTSNLIDNGDVRYFTLGIDTIVSAGISYLVHCSTTGDFAGEESEYLIEEGDDSIPVFYGRYVYITAIVEKGGILRQMTIRTTNTTVDYQFPDVDTSTLDGSVGNRIFTPTRPLSGVGDIKIQAHAATTYAVNLYVSDTATSKVLIPVINSKSAAAPSFTLYGIDNDPRDGVVDITIRAYPRQIMANGSVYIIE